MLVSDFGFELPEELIAKYPLKERSASRLLCVDRNQSVISDKQFTDILDFIHPGDLMVFNNTRVIPARAFGQKASGGKLEVLVERILDEKKALCHIRCSKSPKAGSHVILEGKYNFDVLGRQAELFEIAYTGKESVADVLNQCGHMPLPPYIDREDEASDRERYQTVYSSREGAVAAPTAGLHFTKELLAAIKEKGIETAEATLHVGAGTFQPVRVENINDHVMHKEWLEVSESLVEKVRVTKARGGKVIAVGTTSVRCLETAASDGEIKPYSGDTDIFIYPGYEFKVVDALITNFHLPESTLIMLVSAFAGQSLVKQAYQHAIEQKYRFYSYGDAMFLY